MRREISSTFLVFLIVLTFGLCQLASKALDKWPPKAEADAGFDATYLVNTAGVVSSNGTTAVPLLAIPGGRIAPSAHRFWCGGITIFNTDTVTRTPKLVSHFSGRVMWSCPLPAASGVILDNVNMLASDAGTTANPEGVDLVCESGAANKIGAVGQGYVK